MPCKQVPCRSCGKSIRGGTPTGQCTECFKRIVRGDPPPSAPPVDPATQIEQDQQRRHSTTELGALKKKYDEALTIIERQRVELGILSLFEQGADSTFEIHPREGAGTSEATPVILASDWHSEELVTPAQVNGLNEFNPDICERRIATFFQASTNLMRNHLNPGVHIHDVVVALLGDFITNDIHEELVENVAMRPTEAIVWVQDRIAKGIEFFLNHTDYTYTFVCKVGNHSRTTKKTHFSQEHGHSLEHLLYVYLAGYFRNEPRVKFVIQNGYLTYMDIYNSTVRFHHGHAIKYNGGVGGLTIPANKAVAQWDKARRADLDCFGHFHQTKSDQKWKCNGSLIGYNSFGVAIKGDFEPPRQTLFLVDKKRGATCDWPILL